MVDIAKLGMEVDARQVKAAATELTKLGRAADFAGRTAGKMRAALPVAFKATAAAATGAAVSVAAIYAKQSQLIDQNAKLAQSLGTTYAGLANMQRAADLSGVSTSGLEQATKDLTRRLSQAASGTGPAAQALERLNLTAGQLAQMPLDQRIATINSRIREFIPAAERAAVAGQLFGEEGSLAMQRISPETIADAARQVEVFGLNLSDVDAAKVEMANDAFSTFSMAADGIGKQLTVELAPIIKAVADLFFNAAEEAGGMGNVVSDAVDQAVSAIAFAIDAVDGLGRVFTLVTSGAAIGIGYVVKGITEVQLAIMNLAKMVPGMTGIVETPLAVIETVSSMASAVIEENTRKVQAALNDPLAGERFREFVSEAKIAGENAARLTVESRATAGAIGEIATATGEATSATREQADAVQQQISAIERAAAVWGMSAEEVQIYDLRLKGATESQVAYAQSLLATVAALDAQAEAGRAYTAMMEEMELRTGNEALDRLIMQTEQRRAIIQEAYEADYISKLEHEEAMALLDEQYSARRMELLQQEQAAREEANLQNMANIVQITQAQMNQMQGLFDESSAIGRAFFIASQGLAAANAIINGIQAAMAIRVAYATMAAMAGPAAPGILAAGEVHANVAQGMGFASAAMIGAQTIASFDGGGHTGYGPRTGGIDGKGGFPAILHPQERVIDEYRGQSAGGGSQVINFNLSAPENRRTQEQMARKMAQAQQRQQARLG